MHKGIDYSPILLTRQVQIRHPTSTRQVPDKLHTDNPQILKLITTIGNQQLSVKEMLAVLGLKDRENFMNLFLSPAIREGFVCMLYPESPRHPRQKYLLTEKGKAFLNRLEK